MIKLASGQERRAYKLVLCPLQLNYVLFIWHVLVGYRLTATAAPPSIDHKHHSHSHRHNLSTITAQKLVASGAFAAM